MVVGMLWFNNSPAESMKDKIHGAVEYYKTKYGHTPNTCFVNPLMLEPNPEKPADIDVRPNKSIMPNHFWIGVESKVVVQANG